MILKKWIPVFFYWNECYLKGQKAPDPRIKRLNPLPRP
jgi:hypothetical protein